jgi:hypothetical protein
VFCCWGAVLADASEELCTVLLLLLVVVVVVLAACRSLQRSEAGQTQCQ